MATIDMDNLVKDKTNRSFSLYHDRNNKNTSDNMELLNGSPGVSGSTSEIGKPTLRATVESVISGFLTPFEDENTKSSDTKIAESINKSILFEVEAGMYEAVMHHCKGNQSEAAKRLGVSRGTLRTKLKRYYGTTHVGLI